MKPARVPQDPLESSQDGEFRLHELWHMLRRNLWVALGVTVLAVGLAVIYTMRQAPVYESAATLRIETESSTSNLLSELVPAGRMGQGIIETEMLVLQSRRIAEAVVDSLGLNVRASTAEHTPRAELLEVLGGARTAEPASYELHALEGGAYRVEAVEAVAGAAAPEQVAAGQPIRLGGVSLRLREAPRGTEEIRVDVASFRRTVQALRDELRVTRDDPLAHIIEVRYRDTDPFLAAAVPNAVAQMFIADKAQGSRLEARSTVHFLEGQVASYEQQLMELEDRLKRFREEQQVVSLKDQASEQVKRLAELQGQRDQLAAERASLLNVLQRVDQAASREGEPSPFRELASFPTFLANRAVQDLLQNMTALENERSALAVRRTDQSIDIRGLDQRIAQMEQQLYKLARGYLGSLENQLGTADATLGQFQNVLATIPSREIGFARLTRQQELLAEVYKLLQTRLKEAQIQEAIEPGDVRLIDSAMIPVEPVYPRPLLNLLLATVLGLALGLGAAAAREAIDTKVRTRDDVSRATAGMPILGAIPRIRLDAAAAGNGNGRALVHRLRAPELKNGNRLVTREDPRNPASEAYRSLRTAIIFSGIDHPPQVLVVTSAMPGDGKSTSAANLAITLAQQGTRTLLVDADLRRGLLHTVTGGRFEPGLAHVLFGHASLEEAVQKVPVVPPGEGEPLHFLSAGVFPPNPAELIGSERMRALVAQLREQYEAVIFDAPPLNLVTDSAVIGRYADATLLVTRAGTTDKRALAFAASQLRHLGTAVGGVVINDVDVQQSGYGHAYQYYGSND